MNKQPCSQCSTFTVFQMVKSQSKYQKSQIDPSPENTFRHDSIQVFMKKKLDENDRLNKLFF